MIAVGTFAEIEVVFMYRASAGFGGDIHRGVVHRRSTWPQTYIVLKTI